MPDGGRDQSRPADPQTLQAVLVENCGTGCVPGVSASFFGVTALTENKVAELPLAKVTDAVPTGVRVTFAGMKGAALKAGPVVRYS